MGHEADEGGDTLDLRWSGKVSVIKLAFLSFFILSGIGSTSTRAQSIDLDYMERSIETIEKLCLSNRHIKGSLGIEVKGLWDGLKKAVSGALKLGGEVEEVRGAVGEFSEVFRESENNAIRICMDKYVLRWEAFLISDEEVSDVVVLMDGDHISYEKDVCATNTCRQNARSNRVVLREALKGELGVENDLPLEYGIYPGWDKISDIVKLKPSLVILHWSGFESDGANDNGKLSCSPVDGNRCSELIIENLSKINTRSNDDPRFIIYSREKWLCGKEFRNGLLSRIPKSNLPLADKIGLISVHQDYERERTLSNQYSVADIRDMASFFLGAPSPFESDEHSGICILSW
ncbi:hypothetical protein [Mangrovicoccus sp. HB161399]|uniref:hypothetical protein n=1 Tax=Mangrovicoccus sp. HB161399 TaxID=2720392 RepID=UPI00155269BE|nr:hypothetical protein [Mangrovicoccus sp. HB161399]